MGDMDRGVSDADRHAVAEILRCAIAWGEAYRAFDRFIPDGAKFEPQHAARQQLVGDAEKALLRAVNALIEPGGVKRPIVHGEIGRGSRG